MVGRWPTSPFDAFADVMHEAPDGVRTLLAPTQQVADFGATQASVSVRIYQRSATVGRGTPLIFEA